MHPHLSLVTLGVTDLPRSLVFYRDTLGWSSSAKTEDPVAFFKLENGVILGLYPKHLLAADATVDAKGSGFSGITLAQNMASVDLVDAAFAELASKGVTIVKKPKKTEWGGYSGYFADPDGYLWEVAHNPFWKLLPTGECIL